jgi:uncharacterized protein
VQITDTALRRVDRAERASRRVLHEAGVDVRDLRVRDLGGDEARLELDPAALAAARAHEPALMSAMCEVGFREAGIDPRGFRSGAMNELLATPEHYR